MAVLNPKVPVTIVALVIGVALGIGGTWVAMYRYGYHWEKQDVTGGGGPPQRGGVGAEQTVPPPGQGGAAEGKGGAPKGNGMPKGGRGRGGPAAGGPGGGMPGGGFGGGRGPGVKSQLTGLITTLDVLVTKPLSVELTPEQKKRILGIIKDLGDKDELTDQEAQKRLDALVEALGSYRETFEAAGYVWPVGQPGGGSPPAPNPFKAAAMEKHLKSLNAGLSNGEQK